MTDEFRARRFHLADFSDAVWRDCDLSGARMDDCMLAGMCLSGDIDGLVVNDVEVSAFVDAELDRREPLRVVARQATTPGLMRAAWAEIGHGWQATIDRAVAAGATESHVGEEWSLAQTLRHLVFAIDAWVGSSVLDLPQPYHPLGLPAGGYAAEDAARLGLTTGMDAPFDEVRRAWEERRATMSAVLADVDDEGIARGSTRRPAPGYPERTYVVGRCLRVVLNESAEHHRYVVRDLASLGVEA